TIPLFQVLVDGLFDVRIELHRRLVVEGQRLQHDDDADLFHRIDEEVGVENAGPRAAARRAAIGLPLSRELEAEAPLVPARADGEVSRHRLIRRLLHLHRDIGLAHEHHARRLFAEDTLAVQRTVIEQPATEQAGLACRAIQAAITLHGGRYRAWHRQLNVLAITFVTVDG